MLEEAPCLEEDEELLDEETPLFEVFRSLVVDTGVPTLAFLAPEIGSAVVVVQIRPTCF